MTFHSSYLSDQEYEAIAILGASTTTYDSEGDIIEKQSASHVTRELVEKALDKFKGDIKQMPPMFVCLLVLT